MSGLAPDDIRRLLDRQAKRQAGGVQPRATTCDLRCRLRGPPSWRGFEIEVRRYADSVGDSAARYGLIDETIDVCA
jgi:hypothetical protein